VRTGHLNSSGRLIQREALADDAYNRALQRARDEGRVCPVCNEGRFTTDENGLRHNCRRCNGKGYIRDAKQAGKKGGEEVSKKNLPYTIGLAWDAVTYLFEGEPSEAWYNVYKIKEHVMWYVRAIYSPYNRMKVRNVGRRYDCDHNVYLLHAAFTVLCRHVERSLGGRENLVIETEARVREDAANGNGASWGDVYTKMLALYDWYVGVDWKDPVPSNPEWTDEEWAEWCKEDDLFCGETCSEKLKELISIREYLWT